MLHGARVRWLLYTGRAWFLSNVLVLEHCIVPPRRLAAERLKISFRGLVFFQKMGRNVPNCLPDKVQERRGGGLGGCALDRGMWFVTYLWWGLPVVCVPGRGRGSSR